MAKKPLKKKLLMTSSNRPTEAIVDADFLVYKVGFSNEEEEERWALNRLTEWFTDIIYMRLKCDDYRAWITGKTNFRFEVATTVPYKGNRKDAPKPRHYDALRKHLMKLGAKMSENEEADDSVGIASTEGNYWIVHVDKDLDQLPGWHYNPVKDEEYYVTEFEGLYSFYKQILTGDRVDNIEGIRGIGPVKADKILKDCTTEEELYAACIKAYDGNTDRVLENGLLLWLRRKPNQMWQPPSVSQAQSGTLTM
jgi:hypothetical protein